MNTCKSTSIQIIYGSCSLRFFCELNKNKGNVHCTSSYLQTDQTHQTEFRYCFLRIPLLKSNLFQRGKNSLSEVVGRLEIRGTWIRLYIPLPVALHFDAIPFLGSCGVDTVGGSKRDETGEKQAEPNISLYLNIS